MAVARRFVNFQILVNNSGLPREGFGLPGIVTHKALWSGRSRQYSRTADMVTDGLAEDSPEVLAAATMFRQSPPPPFVDLIRATSAVRQHYTIGAIAADKAIYEIDVVGEGVTPTSCVYDSPAGTHPADVHNAMVTQLNAVVGKNYTAAFAPLVYADIVVTADAASNLLDKAAHGLNHGAGPFQFTNVGGALPTGIVAATNYWVIHTTGMDADHFEIATSLALALAGTAVDITTNGTGVTTMSDTVATVDPSLPFAVAAAADNDWFSLSVLDVDLISIVQDHADPGIAADLDAIILKDNAWYWLVTLYNSKAYVLAAAAWVEANAKVYTPSSNDSSACTTSAVDATDLMAVLLGLEYKRTEYKYHHIPAAFLDAGYAGLLSTKNPGLWTGKGKTIVGVPPVPLTVTHENNLDARKANSYTTEGGKNVTWEGRVANPDYGFLDATVSFDWVSNAVILAAFGYTTSVDKVGYDDADIAGIEGAINGVILEAVSPEHKIMAPGTPGDPNDPPPSITFPLVATIPAATRALRKLPNGQMPFRYLGAVHEIDVVATVVF